MIRTLPFPSTSSIISTRLRLIMIEVNLMKDFVNSHNMLNSALDKYLSACSAIQDYSMRVTPSDDPLRREQVMDCAENELPLFASYMERMKRAKAALGTARNCSSRMVPIHTLPCEILSHIFSLVYGGPDPVASAAFNDPGVPGKLPDLYQLCSRWCRVAIDCHALWSSINIPPKRGVGLNKVIFRAEGCAARSDQLPLEVYVSDCHPGPSDNEDLVPFLASISARIGSLKLVKWSLKSDSCCSILRKCFINMVPGMLRQLTLWSTACTSTNYTLPQKMTAPRD